MRGAGTIFAGFADTFVPSARLGELAAALSAPDGGEVASIIKSFAEPPPASELAQRADAITATFAFEAVEEICTALTDLNNEWAHKTLTELAGKSPLSLKLTLAAIRNARSLGSLEEALNVEYRLCTRLFEHGEFIEGVRALLVDKDRSPKWRPPTIEESADVAVANWLAPLPDGEELGLKPPA
jgi:enoyl-CoA hydratase